jgi:signal transduction histidine kinase
MLLFALGSIAAVAVAAVWGYLALRSVAIDEAKRDTRENVVEAAQLVESLIDDGILGGAPTSIERVDDLVVGRVLSDSVVRVKIWTGDGRVLYSDNPAQIGGRFALDAEQRALLQTGGAEVEVSDLDSPENALDRQEGELIEAYTSLRTPSGEPLLFEVYERFDSVTSDARRLLLALAPPILGAIALILLVQVPLVWSLGRRLQRGHEEREALLAGAIAASNRERRRVASYLHDGVVQDLAGVAYGLTALADASRRRGVDDDAAELDRAAEVLRQDVRDLRTLLVDLHPPRLAAAGLEAALADLVSPLEARGVSTRVTTRGLDDLDQDVAAVAYRVAQEAVRNVIAYAGATSVQVDVTADDETVRLSVADDGRGFDAEQRAARVADGHVGLSLLEQLARDAGGTLELHSRVGGGTRVALEVPRR